MEIQDNSMTIKKKESRMLKHLKSMGATNRLALYLVGMLFAGLVMGFVLAVMSIRHDYMGQLLCYTVVFTPIGTALSIVLNSIVNKSRAENTSGDGTGIKYGLAMKDVIYGETEELTETVDNTDPAENVQNSPAI